MTTETIDVKMSTGRVLCTTIFKPGGRKLLSKGHQINADDIKMLAVEGMELVGVTRLEEGEISEDEAVLAVAQEMARGALEIRLAAGGRANIFATQNCALLVDEDLLKQINNAASIVIATVTNFSYGLKGQRVATIKSAPFAVDRAQLEAVVNIMQERGPILQARPIDRPRVGVIYSDAVQGNRARQLFSCIVRQRLERFNIPSCFSIGVTEDVAGIAKALEQLLASRPTVILIASTTAPAGPEDVIGMAMSSIGCTMERFLAPVEPGNLLLMGYKDGIPVISAPGCFRSAKPNVVDLLLPPLLSQYPVSGWEIACLGHGGLLS